VIGRQRHELRRGGQIPVLARDALHAAVVIHHELEAVCSFDTDFDAVAGVRRIEP
jgi:predicted nucleic acid-binding protein